MDEGTGQGEPTVASTDAPGEDKSPEELQEDIARTRSELGDTVEALAHKADVKSRAQERVTELRAAAQQRKADFSAKVKEVTPESAASGVEAATERAKRDPLPFAAGAAFLVGFVLGRRTGR